MKAELLDQIRDPELLKKVETDVFGPLLSLQGRQAKEVFDSMMKEVLGTEYALSSYPPEEAGQHGTSEVPTLFQGSVKEVRLDIYYLTRSVAGTSHDTWLSCLWSCF